MKHLVALLIVATASVALAKPPKLVSVTIDKTTLGVPKGYKAAVGERCIAISGPGSLYVYRTQTSLEDFEKAEKGKRVAKGKAVCFENTKPGEHARCMITTDAGRWVTQFVSFGKKYSALGGAEAMQAIVESIKGWEPKPYDGTYAIGTDCPAVK